MIRKRLKSQRGAAAVEFALVLVPLMLIVLGTIDWGYYFFIREVVTNAAREGARAGAIANDDGVGAANTYLDSVGLSKKAGVCAGAPANSACVQIDYPVGNKGSITGFLSGVLPEKASAKATMRWE